VHRLITHAERTLDAPPPATHRRLLEIVFDNTRRALAAILRSTADPDELRALIAGFWSYQVPGLNGLSTWMRTGQRGDRHMVSTVSRPGSTTTSSRSSNPNRR